MGKHETLRCVHGRTERQVCKACNDTDPGRLIAAERAVVAAAKAWVHAYGTTDALDATPALIRAVEDLFALEAKGGGA